MDRYKSYCDDEKRRLALNMLFYYRLFKKYKRLSEERREKVIVNQRLEVVDGTALVWTYLRSHLVEWLFEIFVRSADQAFEKKKNSYLLFQSNMQDLKFRLGDIAFILLSSYSRIKNLIYDEIPKVEWEKKYMVTEKHRQLEQID